jgi:CTP:molybdopterin cytidylyltransferase MocA
MAPPLTENPLPVAAIVLAAGQGSRMGGGKLLLPVGDASLIALTVRQLLAVPVADIVVVIGVYGLAVQQTLQGLPVRFAVNPDPNSEMAESIRKGLALIDPKNIRAFLILPGDMPLVRPSTVLAVVEALWESDRTVAVPSFRQPQRASRCLPFRPLRDRFDLPKPTRHPTVGAWGKCPTVVSPCGRRGRRHGCGQLGRLP